MGRERRRWTAEEDSLLQEAVRKAAQESRPMLWRELAKSVPGRTNKDCRRRWCNSLAGGVAKGPWTESEDERLFHAVQEYGSKWTRVADDVRTRNSDQCSSHWSQALNPDINYSDWTREEDEALLAAVREHGTNWVKIVPGHVTKRTTLALKNRYSAIRPKSVPTKSKSKSKPAPRRRKMSTKYSTQPGTHETIVVDQDVKRELKSRNNSKEPEFDSDDEDSSEESEEGIEDDNDGGLLDMDWDKTSHNSHYHHLGTTHNTTLDSTLHAASSSYDLPNSYETDLAFSTSTPFDAPWTSSQLDLQRASTVFTDPFSFTHAYDPSSAFIDATSSGFTESTFPVANLGSDMTSHLYQDLNQNTFSDLHHQDTNTMDPTLATIMDDMYPHAQGAPVTASEMDHSQSQFRPQTSTSPMETPSFNQLRRPNSMSTTPRTKFARSTPPPTPPYSSAPTPYRRTDSSSSSSSSGSDRYPTPPSNFSISTRHSNQAPEHGGGETLQQISIEAECTTEQLNNMMSRLVGLTKSVTVEVGR